MTVRSPNLVLKASTDGVNPVSTEPKQTQKDKINQIFDTWDESNAPTVEYDGWKLVGNESKKEDCGRPLWMGCLEHDPAWAIKSFRSCRRPVCKLKSCRWAWINRQSNVAVRKIEEIQKCARMLFGNGFWYVISHVTVSPPKGEYNRLGYQKMRRKAMKLADEAGMYGALVAFHPFRFDASVNEWYWSPHFHLIGCGWTIGYKIKELHERTGWVVRNHGTRRTSGEIFSTIRYILSHAGVKKSNTKVLHTVTWFGLMSYAKLRRYGGFNEKQTNSKCPDCGEKLRPILPIDGDTDRGPPEQGYEGVIMRSNWEYDTYEGMLDSPHSERVRAFVWTDLNCMRASDKANALLRSLQDND